MRAMEFITDKKYYKKQSIGEAPATIFIILLGPVLNPPARHGTDLVFRSRKAGPMGDRRYSTALPMGASCRRPCERPGAAAACGRQEGRTDNSQGKGGSDEKTGKRADVGFRRRADAGVGRMGSGGGQRQDRPEHSHGGAAHGPSIASGRWWPSASSTTVTRTDRLPR